MDLQSNLSSLFLHAEVVKLANTLRSGRSGRESLRVQLPPSAKLGIFNLVVQKRRIRFEI